MHLALRKWLSFLVLPTWPMGVNCASLCWTLRTLRVCDSTAAAGHLQAAEAKARETESQEQKKKDCREEGEVPAATGGGSQEASS